MYHFADIFKKSFLEGWSSTGVGAEAMLITMLVAAFLAAYILLVYRLSVTQTSYSKEFTVALVGVTLITAAIILTIQSNLVISLGMVGALSIVRFRTAIKSPLDLMFLFWAISIGIICGAGLSVIAVILSLALTAVIFLVERYPAAAKPQVLVFNARLTDGQSADGTESAVAEVLKKYAKKQSVKSRSLSGDMLTVTVELLTAEETKLLGEISALPGVTFVNLFSKENANIG